MRNIPWLKLSTGLCQDIITGKVKVLVENGRTMILDTTAGSFTSLEALCEKETEVDVGPGPHNPPGGPPTPPPP